MDGGALISVLLPTRGRPGQLDASVSSLLGSAAHPDQVEVLCAGDPDDGETADMCATMARFYGHDCVRSWTAPERFGYRGMHRYVNFLAARAAGSWLMLWNDDARMVTPGWDEKVLRHSADRVLWPRCNHAQGGNLFPVWPASWHRALGYAALAPNVDVWVSEVARRLGVEERLDVEVMHLRPDVTGAPVDQVHAEGRAAMGPGNDPSYDAAPNRLARARAVRVLRARAGALLGRAAAPVGAGAAGRPERPQRG